MSGAREPDATSAPAAPPDPYVSPQTSMAELSAKAVGLGIVFGVIFGAATVYLALKAGLTVSASIPIAVLAISVFKKIGKSTILENNIVQTIGSAGESIAAGVAFTFPALIFLASGENFFTYFNILTLAFVGGILGVSAKTAETHRMRIMNKIGIRDTAGLVRYAIRRGMIQP